MSLEQQKSQKESLNNSTSLPDYFTRSQKRMWKNTWSFNLRKKFPISSKEDCHQHQIEIKRAVQKYYGKKILYILNIQEINKLIFRSKFLKCAAGQENRISKDSLKYKGNLVMIGAHLTFPQYDSREEKSPNLKKILKHCQKAQIFIWTKLNLKLLKHMLALQNLCVDFTSISQFASLGRIVANFLRLQAIQVQFIDLSQLIDYEVQSWLHHEKALIFNLTLTKPQKTRIFSLLHKLSCLKRVRFTCDSGTIAKLGLEWDLDRFYTRPLAFDFHAIILQGHDFEEHSSSWKIITAAEYLEIKELSYAKPYIEVDLVGVCEEATLRKKNLVEFYIDSLQEKPSRIYEVDHYDNFAYEKRPRNVIVVKEFYSPLLAALYEVKYRCLSLQHLTVNFCTLRFPDIRQSQKDFPQQVSDGFREAVEELSTFDKLKRFQLVTNPNDFYLFPPEKILANKNLEIFKLKLCGKEKKCSSPKWSKCFATATSQVEKLYMEVYGKGESPFFNMNLLKYVRQLENLQIIELIDKRFEVVTLDFLYGFVTSLLEKKKMRKILICTKVVNSVYSKSVGGLFSKSLETQAKNFLDEICEDWEKRAEVLKDLQLEEIMVGRLKGYGFDYVLFNKEMQVVDKIFWTKKEIRKMINPNGEMAKRFSRIFGLLE